MKDFVNMAPSEVPFFQRLGVLQFSLSPMGSKMIVCQARYCYVREVFNTHQLFEAELDAIFLVFTSESLI
jgi:hypothetical protein